MRVFVARQPIFDSKQRVVAYELLFRQGPENFFPVGVDVDMASSRVINDSLSVFGLSALAGRAKVYVNVTRRILCEGLYSVLPNQQAVIEVLETVQPDAQTVTACRDLKRAGYELALDDFVDTPSMEPLVALADVIKVDFLATKPEARQELQARLVKRRPRAPALLAEKVETAQEFRDAQKQGYSFFQGYFFQRPEVIARKDIPSSKLTHLEFLRELQCADLDYSRVEQIIKRDVSLSVKLLRYLNSAAFYWRSKITSLKHALVLLGERPFRKWASLIAIVGISSDSPPELALSCLTRAAFSERLCRIAGKPELELDAFLTGMLSAVDALVGRPLTEVVEEIGIGKDIEAALLRTETPLGQIRGLALAYERGEWDEVSRLAASLNMPEASLPDAYREAITWASQAYPK